MAGDMIRHQNQMYTLEEYARLFAMEERGRITEQLRRGYQQLLRLQMLEEAQPQNANFFRVRIHELKLYLEEGERLAQWNEQVIGRLRVDPAQAARAARDTMADAPDITRSRDTIDQAQGFLRRNSQRVSNSVSRFWNGLGGRLARARDTVTRTWRSVAGGAAGVLTMLRTMGLRATLAHLTAALARGFPGGPAGIAVSLALTLAVVAGFWSRSRPATASAPGGPSLIEEYWALVVVDGKLQLQQLLSNMDPGGDVLAGPGIWADVIRDYCAALDAGSVRQVAGTGWLASFGGRQLVIGDVDREMTRRECGQ